eukprot:Phypoly_transcript_13012.p1 GENE.Phypoly_transcript_13012~~Phypoly_transcript_13012.p1  ORF type:complete len:298 (+),score=27.01 Phypoly_transcript_13012:96-989(+)
MPMSRPSDPFPLTLFSDCASFKATSAPKTSMQFVYHAKDRDSKVSGFPHFLLNQPCQTHKLRDYDTQPSTTMSIHFLQNTKKEISKATEFPCKLECPQLLKSHAISDKDSNLHLPPILSNSSLRLTDTQFTVFLDYPQTKADPAIHIPQPSSCAESDTRSRRNIITHASSPTDKPTQPHAGLLMLLNCAQPRGLSTDPMRPTKRLNDYTGDFKKEFCALLCTNNEARGEWDRFWRKHGCTGKRPCIKAYLAFCELYKEFAELRQNPRYRVLGTRTACRCTRTIHSFQPPKSTRYAPY